MVPHFDMLTGNPSCIANESPASLAGLWWPTFICYLGGLMVPNFGMLTGNPSYSFNISTPDRWQSKMLSTIDERGSKIDRQCFRLPFVASVATNCNRKHCFYRFLSTFLDSIGVFDCCLPGVGRFT